MKHLTLVKRPLAMTMQDLKDRAERLDRALRDLHASMKAKDERVQLPNKK